ncbi:MAG: hypothetical protein JXB49_05910 [Bacteroidales bacterium]|nr:hypothetical protein [Bacteroidales bacterium]
MHDKLKELQANTRENEDLLKFFLKYQIPATPNIYRYLISEIKTMKIQIAELEAVLRTEERKLITMN